MVSLLRLSAKAMAPRVAFLASIRLGAFGKPRRPRAPIQKSHFKGEAMWCREYEWEWGRGWERGREWGREWEWEWE